MYRELLSRLVEADTEEQVTAALREFGFDGYDEINWKLYGGPGVENNRGSIDGQQADPRSALAEKLTNSIDAVLMRACLENGIDPESWEDAPKTMEEAAEMFFAVPEGKLARLSAPRRSELAENIRLAVGGQKSRQYPSVMIVDKGEGQAPEQFPNTFLSLLKGNKKKIHFVQGKNNQGGAGVLPFCGKEHSYQLIVSRRYPTIDSSAKWGFTLVRLRPPLRNETVHVYEYLAPSGEILEIESDRLPLWPTRKGWKDIEGGTFIKLYQYQITERTMAQTDLYYAMSRQLFRVVLPVRIVELRDYKSHTLEAVLSGMDVRLDQDRAEVLEDGFPLVSDKLHIPDVGEARLTIALFKSSTDTRRWVHSSEAVLFTVNGQTHAVLSNQFVRHTVGFKHIAGDLLVEVDCSRFPQTLISKLFMTSRDRMRQIEEMKTIEGALASFIKHQPALRQWNEERRRKKIEASTTSEEYVELYENLIRNNPDLVTILSGKGALTDPTKKGTKTKRVKQRRFPTHLRLPKSLPRPYIKECPHGTLCRVQLETDAPDDYLGRVDDRGELNIEVAGFAASRSLLNGTLTLTFQAEQDVQVGQTKAVRVRMSTPAVPGGWLEESFELKATARRAPDAKRRKRRRKRPQERRSGDLALPEIREVREDGWEQYDWGPEDVLELDTDNGRAVAYVNVDNVALKRYQYENARDPAGFKEQFKIATTVFALVCEKAIRSGNGPFTEEQAQLAATEFAKVILPLINSLANIDEED